MKPFTRITVLLLSLVAVIHLIRMFTGWEVVVRGNLVPVWVSIPAALIFGGLAWMVHSESRR